MDTWRMTDIHKTLAATIILDEKSCLKQKNNDKYEKVHT